MPALGVKNEIQPVKDEHSTHIHLTKGETGVDKLVLAEFAFGTLAGVIAYVAATLTTFVEVHGFWRPFWLVICIASFACATGLIVEGARNFSKRA